MERSPKRQAGHVERGDRHSTPVLSSSTLSVHGRFSWQVLQRLNASVLPQR